jgi:transposase-like protein
MHQTTRMRRRRRTKEEIAHLMAEYSTSGLSRAAFCRTHQLSLSTLARYREHAAPAAGDGATSSSFLAVELAGTASASTESGLALLLAGGRHLTIQRGFCAETLQQLLSALERR